MGQMVERALDGIRSAIADAGASVRVGALPTVMADAGQMESLMLNLISNAIKYRHPSRPPEIVITADQPDKGVWRIVVRDNGIGIEPEYYDKIFELFQRLSPADCGEGTGIGLALCRRIVRRCGGEIWVESVPEQGSAFFFTLPAAPPTA